MAEWIISGNLKYYNFVDAFHDLKKIDWRQYADYKVGDDIYIYSSGKEKAIRFKCKVNKVNLKKREIVDDKYDKTEKNIAEEYAEVEMIEEYDSKLYSLLNLKKHGFKAPFGTADKMKPETKKYLNIVDELLKEPEMDPDKHDGSYELMRATIEAYAQMENQSNLDFNDLDLIYSMSIITKKDGISTKENNIDNKSNLPKEQKENLKRKLNKIWDNVEKLKYKNKTEDYPCIGMFNTGFRTFENQNNEPIQKFIKMCIDIRNMPEENDERIFKYCADVLNDNFKIKNMQTGAASVILHCLKPTVFPILNSNMGNGNIYEYFGVKLEDTKSINTYITNCREIKKFRDSNFKVKNYRIFDIEARKLGKDENIHTDINYRLVSDFLEENGGVKYSDPEKIINKEEKEKFRTIKQEGQKATNELKKMAKLCEKKFELKKDGKVDFLKTSRTETKNYLWVQLKYSQYIESPESISIFVEKDKSNHVRFRFSLELKIEGSDEKEFKKYHRHLDIPISNDSSLVYVCGLANEEIIKDTDVVKSKIKNVDLANENERKKNKIQICKIIECNDKITNDDIEAAMLDGIQKLIPYYEYVLGIDTTAKEHPSLNEGINTKTSKFDKNMILYGPPGTGKTYNTVNYAVAIIEEKNINEIKNANHKEILEKYNYFKEKERIKFITFHQSYGYEEFIEGIKPNVKTKEDDKQLEGDKQEERAGKIEYTIKPGIFKEFCDKARDKDEPYVFIIDEINRGNISKIFGELITLIEPTKRDGAPEATETILPYSNEPFSVPNNVYIIGTMNTADRSIALLDTALRRRFQFIEMMPDSKVLNYIGADKIKENRKELDVAKMLDVMNKRIGYLYDRDHTIGHAFFTELATEPTLQKLGNIFQKSIIPLLQEYFYEDYNKIMLVLGDNGKDEEHSFIKKTENEQSSIFKGDVSMYDFPEYSYEINEDAFKNIESYIEIIGEENKDKNEFEEEEE